MADEPVVDFDSRRRARENAAAADRARQQRERLNETRTAHAPLTREQSNAVRAHRRTVTTQADARRNALRIANCQLCDGDGYTPNRTICDHIDHRPAAVRGMAAVRAAMGWDDDNGPHDG
ncbi:hypothetical protein ACJEIK_26365 [Mycobacterium sp. SMC-16]|uniref:hypothetical protein n=1 Tax=Mycobacterium sp. SMC-16 TaxID=3385967 RepID=UPI00390CA197